MKLKCLDLARSRVHVSHLLSINNNVSKLKLESEITIAKLGVINKFSNFLP